MERLPPTRALALKVWWAFMWRAAVGSLAAAVLVGMVVGAATTALGITDNSALTGLMSLIGMAIGVGISLEVMYRVLKKRFAGFEVALIKTE